MTICCPARQGGAHICQDHIQFEKQSIHLCHQIQVKIFAFLPEFFPDGLGEIPVNPHGFIIFDISRISSVRPCLSRVSISVSNDHEALYARHLIRRALFHREL